MIDTSNETDLVDLVERSRRGDRLALEALVRAIADRVYNLAIRMLSDPADAADASQEILIRVVTNLGAFRGEAAFSTWVYRVAANHLLTMRQRRFEQMNVTFAMVDEHLDRCLTMFDRDPAGYETRDPVLIEEAKIQCTEAMLLALDREERITYVLGEILELPSEQGAAILDIRPQAFRKRLSRARSRVEGFMAAKCGLTNPGNPCRCHKQVAPAVELGVLDADRLRFATHARRTARTIERLATAAEVFRSHPEYQAPDTFVDAMKRALDRV
jgi:RNA polymerase sigma factor (sigma-70 family)